MKIRIFTLPLWGNYGGILQAYALYRVCSAFSPDVTILQDGTETKQRPFFLFQRY